MTDSKCRSAQSEPKTCTNCGSVYETRKSLPCPYCQSLHTPRRKPPRGPGKLCKIVFSEDEDEEKKE